MPTAAVTGVCRARQHRGCDATVVRGVEPGGLLARPAACGCAAQQTGARRQQRRLQGRMRGPLLHLGQGGMCGLPRPAACMAIAAGSAPLPPHSVA